MRPPIGIVALAVGVVAGVCLLGAGMAEGQRVQFATPLPAASSGAPAVSVPAPNAPAAPPSTYSVPPAAGSAAVPPSGFIPPAAGSAPSGAAPAYSMPPAAPGYAAPGYATPSYGQPGYGAPPASPSYVSPAPGAALEGTIAPPPPQWDQYATPGAAPAPLFPNDPNFGIGPGYGPGYYVAAAKKFREATRFTYEFMPGNSARELGLNRLEIDSTFAFPLFFNTQTPIKVTPGFAIDYWAGPQSMPEALSGKPPADLPPQTFDAYLDAAWNPQINAWLGAELSFRVGIYSDFQDVTTDSIRFPSKGMLVLSNLTPSLSVKAGVWYLDRVRVKLLPAGGFIWKPSQRTVFEILFPNPRVAHQLGVYAGATEWWLYARGDYGGGSWTVKRADLKALYGFPSPAAGMIDQVDYNDLRFAVGLEFKQPNLWKGFFETGLSFERELRYASRLPTVWYLNSTVFVQGGVEF